MEVTFRQIMLGLTIFAFTVIALLWERRRTS